MYVIDVILNGDARTAEDFAHKTNVPPSRSGLSRRPRVDKQQQTNKMPQDAARFQTTQCQKRFLDKDKTGEKRDAAASGQQPKMET
ncbi:hypothetical protein BaRGS_00002694 [Batillaria attramentaria]|uniref:Uncharacterized protein n=1 Tax=Batillaria attramentaria TaxID=370345 RepID=A0ABD0M2X4_9CAEN